MVATSLDVLSSVLFFVLPPLSDGETYLRLLI